MQHSSFFRAAGCFQSNQNVSIDCTGICFTVIDSFIEKTSQQFFSKQVPAIELDNRVFEGDN